MEKTIFHAKQNDEYINIYFDGSGRDIATALMGLFISLREKGFPILDVIQDFISKSDQEEN